MNIIWDKTYGNLLKDKINANNSVKDKIRNIFILFLFNALLNSFLIFSILLNIEVRNPIIIKDSSANPPGS
ncbi:hypothetical protein JCM15415_13520 [Methanobacterium movens]